MNNWNSLFFFWRLEPGNTWPNCEVDPDPKLDLLDPNEIVPLFAEFFGADVTGIHLPVIAVSSAEIWKVDTTGIWQLANLILDNIKEFCIYKSFWKIWKIGHNGA